MVSVKDVRFKQVLLLEFAAAGKESVISDRKREICDLLGYCAV